MAATPTAPETAPAGQRFDEPVAGRPMAFAIPGGTGVITVLIGMLITGAGVAQALRDPGATVRFGLPLLQIVVDLAGGLALGSLVLAATALSPASKAWLPNRRTAVLATAVWTVAAVLRVVFDYASVTGIPLGDPGFGDQLRLYVTEVQRGQLLLTSAVIAAVAAMLAVAASGPLGNGVAGIAVAGSMLAIAFTGHSAGARDHELAVSSLWLHVLGLGVWTGGLAALAFVNGKLTDGPSRHRALPAGERAAVVARYSSLAALGFLAVGSSGIGNAVIRVGSWSRLATAYGALLVVKVVVLVALGVAGMTQRRAVVAKLTDASSSAQASRLFGRLALGELALMGLAAGFGVAMAASAPPLAEGISTNPTPAEIVTGEPLPPPMTPARLITQFTPDILWLLIVVLLVVFYLSGVRTLRRRGDAWPASRVVLWLSGCVALLYVTCGGYAVYGRTSFSAHMVQHMALTMVSPLLLTFGAPMSLLLRTCPARHDGSRGPREWVLGLIESRWIRFFANPMVAAVNFSGSIIVFYFSPLFGLALRTHLGHELMMLHFTLAGYMFAQAIVGIDPGARPLPYPLRLVLLFMTMGFHSFFGVAVMGSSSLIQSTYFSSLGTGLDLLADQAKGGAIAWGIGEVPTLMLAVVMAVQWSSSDEREGRRRDRAADRDGDVELREYNEMLSKLSPK